MSDAFSDLENFIDSKKLTLSLSDEDTKTDANSDKRELDLNEWRQINQSLMPEYARALIVYTLFEGSRCSSLLSEWLDECDYSDYEDAFSFEKNGFEIFTDDLPEQTPERREFMRIILAEDFFELMKLIKNPATAHVTPAFTERMTSVFSHHISQALQINPDIISAYIRELPQEERSGEEHLRLLRVRSRWSRLPKLPETLDPG